MHSEIASEVAPDRAAHYRQLLPQMQALLQGVEDEVAAMATFACLLKESLPYASWVGFYRVVEPELLRVGPYQGPMGCLEIAFSKGVCGAAATQQKTQRVDDVHAFPGHIACDATARSEIVVPVHDSAGQLRAVLDVDSREPAAFNAADQSGLEELVKLLQGSFGPS